MNLEKKCWSSKNITKGARPPLLITTIGERLEVYCVSTQWFKTFFIPLLKFKNVFWMQKFYTGKFFVSNPLNGRF